MDTDRRLAWGTAAVMLLVVVASGPLVGAVDLTRERAEPALGDGTARVTVDSLPDRVLISPGRYDSGGYVVRVPDAVVSVDAVDGRPVLVYKLRVPDLGFVRLTTHALDEADAGRQLRVVLEPGPFGSGRTTPGSYEGELLLVVRGQGNAEVIGRAAVAVEVVE